MRIGIIGTGNIGGTIARKLVHVGHDVRVCNARGVAGAQRLADEIGARADSVEGVVQGVEVVILAIPLPAMRELPAGLFDTVPPDVTVIDTSNYYPGMRDSRIAEIDEGMAESVYAKTLLNALMTGRPIWRDTHTLSAIPSSISAIRESRMPG